MFICMNNYLIFHLGNDLSNYFVQSKNKHIKNFFPMLHQERYLGKPQYSMATPPFCLTTLFSSSNFHLIYLVDGSMLKWLSESGFPTGVENMGATAFQNLMGGLS